MAFGGGFFTETNGASVALQELTYTAEYTGAGGSDYKSKRKW